MSQLFTYFTAECAKAMKSQKTSSVFSAEVAEKIDSLLAKISQDSFVEEVAKSIEILQGGSQTSPLFEAYAQALAQTAIPLIEGVEVSDESVFTQAVKRVVTQQSFHEVIREVQTTVKKAGLSQAHLQIATEVDTQTRLALRSDFSKKYPHTILIITVQPDLLGGVRLFKDNTVVDMSWNAQLQSILSV